MFAPSILTGAAPCLKIATQRLLRDADDPVCL
jgi:hypothetical protein